MGSNGPRSREREICAWIGRMGAVEVRHVGERWRVGRSVAYSLVQRLVDAGLLARIATLRGDPTLITATSDGLRYARVGLAPAKASLAQVDHWICCADVALWAERRWGAEAVLSEREVRAAELERNGYEGPLGSCVVGELPNGRPMLHRPDLLVVAGEERIAIEVELTTKGSRRLERIVRAWRRARHVDRVLYFIEPGPTCLAVQRAIERARAEERVEVRDLREVDRSVSKAGQ